MEEYREIREMMKEILAVLEEDEIATGAARPRNDGIGRDAQVGRLYGEGNGEKRIESRESKIGYTFQHKWYAFVMFEENSQRSVGISLTETFLKKLDKGIVMRIVAGGKNFEYATNCFSKDFLMNKARELRQKAQDFLKGKENYPVYKPLTWKEEIELGLDEEILRQVKDKGEVDFKVEIASNDGKGRDAQLGRLYGAMTEIVDMAQMARGYRKRILDEAGKNVATVGATLRQKVKTKIFIDRCKNMSQQLLTSLVYLYAVSPHGKTARVIRGGMAGFDKVCDITQKDISYLVEMPEKFDNAKHLMPGRYKIITGPDVTGVFAHEAFGHTQEGDSCRVGRSCATILKKENKRVGNDYATIVNNAALFKFGKHNFGQNGSHFFDDEGQLARSHVILDKGYLQTPMNDLLSALLGDANGPAPRQSNGKRESWRNPIFARQTNTYFTPGDKTLDELISMVDYGFLAEHAYGGMEDPKGMGLTAGTEYLEEIKDGRLTGEVFLGPQGGHVELSDPVPMLLNGIIAKSHEQDFNIKWGGCGKYHKEYVEAGSGGTYILWTGINCG